ncbi:hypothetical protein Ait01nite_030540 [Actinoplanes italicus]|uniref:DNA-binding XRE family transcriptional regulator n=1 Tax=Actinoplanes italicus TaxID=113567 RepID=A0A2T0KJ10_9ACTN|nr:helix-turn-helix transcriptional regulator [Actinoplanes italicus]PRX23513.1 DNA-binding XRE family transcriptional regulator [Actinoplanes italicus]GIE30009.1 hypothetical protein Ait01nite_030540 [Actinoplanes italicus]
MTDTAPPHRQVTGDVDGQLIRKLRVEQGFTAATLARKAKPASLQHICDIERGRRKPSPVLLSRIAKALNTTSADLMRTPEAAGVNR